MAMDPLKSFDEEKRARVNRAVEAAERKTSAEILPVVAASSGRYERAEDLVGLWGALLLFALLWVSFQGVSEETRNWVAAPAVRLGFWPLLAALVAGFFGGVLAAGRLSWLRRLFVPRVDMEREVVARAKSVFFDQRLHRGGGGQGVLFYLSLFERRVVILVDDTVAEHLSERALGEVCRRTTEGLEQGGLANGLEKGLERIGELLAAALPAGEDGTNRVADQVVVLG